MNNLLQQMTGLTEEQLDEEMGLIEKAIESYKPRHTYEITDENWDEKMYSTDSVNGCKRGKNRTRGKRMNWRLNHDHIIKPGKIDPMSYKLGFKIIDNMDHKSFGYKDYEGIMDDMEFLYLAARRTASPQDCPHFFYEYVNQYLKKNEKFRLEFLKNLYLNEHVLTKEDIIWFVETYGFEKENEIIIHDAEFKKEVEKTFLDEKDVGIFIERHDNVYNRTKGSRRLQSYTDFNNEYQVRVNSLLRCFEKQTKVKMNEDTLIYED